MDYFTIHESSSVTMGPTLKRRKSQEGMYSYDKNRVRELRSQSRAKELFNVILSAGLLNGKGTSKGFHVRDMVGLLSQRHLSRILFYRIIKLMYEI